jgi:hypothetical protein
MIPLESSVQNAERSLVSIGRRELVLKEKNVGSNTTQRYAAVVAFHEVYILNTCVGPRSREKKTSCDF